MKTNLLLNPATLKSAKRFIAKPSNGLLLVGPPGAGKLALAKYITAAVLDLEHISQVDEHHFVVQIARDSKKKDIPIDSIRQVIRQLNLKTVGSNDIRRAVIIEDAKDLSLPAQNALLKTLEESPVDCLFILTVNGLNDVLPTIASRLARLNAGPVSRQQAVDYFKDYDSQAVEIAWQLSQGRAGLMQALLQQGTDHSLKRATEKSKQLVAGKPYEALIELERLDDDHSLNDLIDGLDRVLSALDHAAIKKSDAKRHKSLLQRRRLISDLKKTGTTNANQKLMLLDLALNLKL